MSDPDLARLEHQIGRVLRLGVLISASVLGLGLLLALLDIDGAEPLLRAGLVLVMAIPLVRIGASFVDAVRRRDRLLVGSTAIVLLVMMASLLFSLRVR